MEGLKKNKLISIIVTICMLLSFTVGMSGVLAGHAEATGNFTVRFETYGGSVVASLPVVSGGTVSRPADPTEAGCTFGGWYSDNTFDTPFDFSTVINSDTTLYAKWITFQNNFDTDTSSQWTPASGTWGYDAASGSYAQTDTAVNQYFTFANGTDWENYTLEADVKITGGTGNDTGIVFRASGPSMEYFDMLAVRNNGLELYSHNPNYGSLKAVPATITASAWHHVKIRVSGSDISTYFDNNALLSLTGTDTSIKSGKIGLRTNTTSAQFDNVSVYGVSNSVSFSTGGGSAVAAVTVDYGKTVSKPADPTKGGDAIFAGWYADSGYETEFDFSKPITGVTTVYAKWDTPIRITQDGSTFDLPDLHDGGYTSLTAVLAKLTTTPSTRIVLEGSTSGSTMTLNETEAQLICSRTESTAAKWK